MKKIVIVGIQGVPAKYGGFESLVENLIGDNCPSDIHYTVFCSSKDYAERLGVSKALLSFYLRPGRVKTFRVVEKLAKPLNINPKDLIL